MRGLFLTLIMLGVLGSVVHADTKQWQLVWSDEFHYQGLPDKSKWDYEEGFVRNQEQQYYTRDRLENARVENGMLVIEARKEEYRNPRYTPHSHNWKENRAFAHYTSASLITRNKADWQYGRIEVRAKLPQGQGVWPAIWMLGSNAADDGWLGSGEIDIMEYVGQLPDLIHGTVHFLQGGKQESNGGQYQCAQPCADFHTYAIEWYPDHIDFFFDNVKYHTFKLSRADQGDYNPFRNPQYLILNFALGGSWGGSIDDRIFPQRFLIKYVRVYKLKDSPPNAH